MQKLHTLLVKNQAIRQMWPAANRSSFKLQWAGERHAKFHRRWIEQQRILDLLREEFPVEPSVGLDPGSRKTGNTVQQFTKHAPGGELGSITLLVWEHAKRLTLKS